MNLHPTTNKIIKHKIKRSTINFITPNNIYDSLIIYDNYNEYLSSGRQILSGDIMAGILMAIIATNFNISIEIEMNIFHNTESLEILLLEYIIIMSIIPSDIYKPEDNKYGWWIKKSKNIYYLCQFMDDKFISSFITLCDIFNIDFRDFIAGPPFYYSNNKKNIVNVKGYDIDIFNPKEKVPEKFYIEAFVEEQEDPY